MCHATNYMAKSVHPNTVVKTKAFLHLLGTDSIYEVVALQYTPFPQGAINKAHK